jgi:hypothetical protein
LDDFGDADLDYLAGAELDCGSRLPQSRTG